MTRRGLLLAVAAATARGAAISRFRFGLCNNAFSGRPFPYACEMIRQAGFSGIEIDPGTLAPDATALSALERRVVRNALVDNGLQLAGIHNLLDSPAGLHATTNDATRRRRTWDHLRRMVDLCADIGDSSYVILGSGRQRATVEGVSVADATARLRDGLSELAGGALIRSVTVVLEPLPNQVTNVVNTIEQAAVVVRKINSAAVRTMLNTRGTGEETLPAANLIRAYAPLIRYVHMSEADGSHPGARDTDFRPLLQALKDTGYPGWVSAEVTDPSPGPERMAVETAAHLRKIEASLR